MYLQLPTVLSILGLSRREWQRRLQRGAMVAGNHREILQWDLSVHSNFWRFRKLKRCSEPFQTILPFGGPNIHRFLAISSFCLGFVKKIHSPGFLVKSTAVSPQKFDRGSGSMPCPEGVLQWGYTSRDLWCSQMDRRTKNMEMKKGKPGNNLKMIWI